MRCDLRTTKTADEYGSLTWNRWICVRKPDFVYFHRVLGELSRYFNKRMPHHSVSQMHGRNICCRFQKIATWYQRKYVVHCQRKIVSNWSTITSQFVQCLTHNVKKNPCLVFHIKLTRSCREVRHPNYVRCPIFLQKLTYDSPSTALGN